MDKALLKEQAKERMKRYRQRNKAGENVTQSPDSVTESVDSVTQDVTQYHPILEALINPIKRKGLKKICEALGHRNLQPRLYYGCGDYSISFDTVEDLLDATK